MAKFEPVVFAPFGLQRERRPQSAATTKEQRSAAVAAIATKLANLVPQAELEKPYAHLQVSLPHSDVYLLEMVEVTSTSLVAQWYFGATTADVAASTMILTGRDESNDDRALVVGCNNLFLRGFPDFYISEIDRRIKGEASRPVVATACLHERSYDSPTLNFWAMALGHAYLDRLNKESN